MKSKQKGKLQKTAAAIAGFSERSCYRVEERELKPVTNQRNWNLYGIKSWFRLSGAERNKRYLSLMSSNCFYNTILITFFN